MTPNAPRRARARANWPLGKDEEISSKQADRNHMESLLWREGDRQTEAGTQLDKNRINHRIKLGLKSLKKKKNNSYWRPSTANIRWFL